MVSIESDGKGPTWPPRVTTQRTDDIAPACTRLSTRIAGRRLRLASLRVPDTGHHRIVHYDPATACEEVVEMSGSRRTHAVDGMQSR